IGEVPGHLGNTLVCRTRCGHQDFFTTAVATACVKVIFIWSPTLTPLRRAGSFNFTSVKWPYGPRTTTVPLAASNAQMLVTSVTCVSAAAPGFCPALALAAEAVVMAMRA